MTDTGDEFECPTCGYWENQAHVYPASGHRPCEVIHLDEVDISWIDWAYGIQARDNIAHQTFGGPSGMINDPPEGTPG